MSACILRNETDSFVYTFQRALNADTFEQAKACDLRHNKVSETSCFGEMFAIEKKVSTQVNWFLSKQVEQLEVKWHGHTFMILRLGNQLTCSADLEGWSQVRKIKEIKTWSFSTDCCQVIVSTYGGAVHIKVNKTGSES